jgi:hypothetical protein
MDRSFRGEYPFVGSLDSEIGQRMADALASYLILNWVMANVAVETDDYRIDTICYLGYPTSYIPDAVASGHRLTTNSISCLRSITYPSHRPSGTPSAYV